MTRARWFHRRRTRGARWSGTRSSPSKGARAPRPTRAGCSPSAPGTTATTTWTARSRCWSEASAWVTTNRTWTWGTRGGTGFAPPRGPRAKVRGGRRGLNASDAGSLATPAGSRLAAGSTPRRRRIRKVWACAASGSTVTSFPPRDCPRRRRSRFTTPRHPPRVSPRAPSRWRGRTRTASGCQGTCPWRRTCYRTRCITRWTTRRRFPRLSRGWASRLFASSTHSSRASGRAGTEAGRIDHPHPPGRHGASEGWTWGGPRGTAAKEEEAAAAMTYPRAPGKSPSRRAWRVGTTRTRGTRCRGGWLRIAFCWRSPRRGGSWRTRGGR
mmetsp:Transcript_1628/g.6333  ORF Transcript_1628/g.6333 Transcript_1628/m.6333 type:complete len:326 (+) Transcript_1628:1988-2965(+)